MKQQELDFSVPVHRVIRKGAPGTSVEAALSTDLAKNQKTVYEAIKQFGDKGCISDEVLDYLKPRPYGSITSQYGFLIEKGYVGLTGEKRPGRSGKNQRVMRAIK
jgi:hypothetical protein